eukprot:205022_1
MDNKVSCCNNQICFCGRKVIKYPNTWRKCYSCCKVIEKRRKTYYYCNAEQCMYRKMTGDGFKVCSECYESTDDSTIASTHSFLFGKMASAMERIKKRTNLCHNNDERRRYMYWVRILVHRRCIAKIQQSMNENEYKELQRMFNAFYDGVMEEIKSSIDLEELRFAHDMFVTKKDLNRKEWSKMNKISLKWHTLVSEDTFEKEKEEKQQKGIKCDDMCCNDNTRAQCGCRKRIQLVMSCYRQNFLKRFVYDDTDGGDDMQYIDIFECAFDGYSPTDLLNDYFHIEAYHTHDKG